LSKAELITQIAENHGLTKTGAKAVVEEVFAAVAIGLKTEGRFAFPDLGTFSIGSRAARKGRNPSTGAEIKIAASKTVKFKAAPALKAVVQKTKAKAKK
jgi:DNA-binding protein HU-beta